MGTGGKKGDTPLPGGLPFDPNREGRRLRVPPFCLSRAPSPRPPPHRAAARRLRAGGGPWPARRRRSPASTAGRPGPGLGTGMPTGARLGTALRMSLQRKSSKIHSSAGEGRMGARRGWRLGGGGRSEGSPGGGGGRCLYSPAAASLPALPAPVGALRWSSGVGSRLQAGGSPPEPGGRRAGGGGAPGGGPGSSESPPEELPQEVQGEQKRFPWWLGTKGARKGRFWAWHRV